MGWLMGGMNHPDVCMSRITNRHIFSFLLDQIKSKTANLIPKDHISRGNVVHEKASGVCVMEGGMEGGGGHVYIMETAAHLL